MKSLVLFVALVVSQALLRPPAPEHEGQGETLRSRFPGAVHAVMLGGFRPVVVQFLWWDLERAYGKGRDLEVLQTLALLRQVEPDNARAIWYLARFMAYDVGGREATTSGRLGRIVEALAILEDAEKRLPDDVSLPRQRGAILSDERLWADGLYTAYETRTGRTPHEEAARAYGRALDLAPGSPVLPVVLADSLRMQAIGELHGEGPAAAAAILGRAVVVVGRDSPSSADQRPPSSAARLCVAWERVVSGLSRSSARVAAEGVAALAAALDAIDGPGEGGTGLEERLVVSILKLLVALGKEAALGGPPDDALFLLNRIHSIQALLETRLASGRGGGWSDPSLRPELRSMAAQILRRAPALEGRIPEDLRR